MVASRRQLDAPHDRRRGVDLYFPRDGHEDHRRGRDRRGGTALAQTGATPVRRGLVRWRSRSSRARCIASGARVCGFGDFSVRGASSVRGVRSMLDVARLRVERVRRRVLRRKRAMMLHCGSRRRLSGHSPVHRACKDSRRLRERGGEPHAPKEREDSNPYRAMHVSIVPPGARPDRVTSPKRAPAATPRPCAVPYFGHPPCGIPPVIRSAFPKYTFFSTASGRSIPYSFQNAWYGR